MQDALISEYQALTTEELNEELALYGRKYKEYFNFNQFTVNSMVLRTIKQHTTAIQTVLNNRVNK